MKDAHDIWLQNRKSLREHIKGGFSNMLSWSTVRATMYVGDGEVVRKCLESLADSGDRQFAYACNRLGVGLGDDLIYGSLGSNAVHQYYHLKQWMDYSESGVSKIESIAEFGGGFGEMLHIISRMGFRGRYVIYDFPELIEMQKYYISKVGVNCEVVYRSDMMRERFDLVIGLSSLGETSLNTRQDFMNHTDFNNALFTYCPIFGNVNNEKYFQDLEKSKGSLSWVRYLSPVFPSHTYALAKNEILTAKQNS